MTDNIFARLWKSPLIREFLLLVVATIAVQLGLGLGQLLSLLETAEGWHDVVTSFGGWFDAFSFSLFLTITKQSIVWIIQKLAGVKSVTVKGNPEPPMKGSIV